MSRRRLIVPVVLFVAAAGLAMAQPGGTRPGGGRPGADLPGVPSVPGAPNLPGQPGGGQPNFDPQQFIDRLMQGDANGDGKLSRSEVSPQFAERNFDRFDTSGDGFIDRAELEAGSANLRGGGGGGAGAGRMPLARAMRTIDDAVQTLKGSSLDARSLARDLAQIQTMEEGFIAAKFHAATEEFPPQVLERVGGDQAAARMEFREHLIEGLTAALEIETALMSGDAAAVRAGLAKLAELEDESHAEFRVD